MTYNLRSIDPGENRIFGIGGLMGFLPSLCASFLDLLLIAHLFSVQTSSALLTLPSLEIHPSTTPTNIKKKEEDKKKEKK